LSRAAGEHGAASARVEFAAGAGDRRMRVYVEGGPAALERRFEELAKLG
jgi:hypothetical protein